MAEFDRPLPSFRLVKTQYGDTLQDVAMRELGDENRWIELVWLNDLISPYLTDDSALAGGRVVLNGNLIRVPAPAGVYADPENKGQVYERDCKMVNRRLVLDEFGDIAVVAGVANLTQQLRHRINTPTGQLRRHPEYGCRIHHLRGQVAGPVALQLSRDYVKATIQAEYRISSVVSVAAEIEGDVTRVHAVGEAIAGDRLDFITTS